MSLNLMSNNTVKTLENPCKTGFDRALELILRLEGADTNDPRDPGKLTRFGIAQASHPNIDVADLTKADAAEIYANQYWKPLRCEDMPPAVALAVFDCAVNQGPGIAARLLQRAARVREDGVIGPHTLAAIFRAPEAVLDDFIVGRLIRYTDTGNFDRFGKGWFARVVAVQHEAVRWLYQQS